MWALVSGDKFPTRKGRQSQLCAELGLPLSCGKSLEAVRAPSPRKEETNGWAGSPPGPAMPSTTPTLCNLSWRKRSQTEALWDLPHIGLPPGSGQMQNTALLLRQSQQLRGCGLLSSCPRVHRLHGSKADEKRPKLKPEAHGGSGASPSVLCVSGGLVGP